jgi:hypothetical protein
MLVVISRRWIVDPATLTLLIYGGFHMNFQSLQFFSLGPIFKVIDGDDVCG